jgi:transcriptional regulator with XRE-family HTH domain
LIFVYHCAVPKTDTSHAIAQEVTRRLREQRIRAGLSIYRVAKKSGVSQQMIGYVERGMRNPTLQTLLRIAEALQIDLSKLIKQASTGIKHENAPRTSHPRHSQNI